MDFGWILLGFVGIMVVFTFLHVVTRMASERESIGRRRRASMSSLSADTATYGGHG